MKKLPPLSPAILRKSTNPKQFDFETTDDITAYSDFIGQTRALDAMQFGIGIQSEGYNLFAMGPPGIGKRSLVGRVLETASRNEPIPADWCYVNNFIDPQKPIAIELPPGYGIQLRQDMESLVEDLQTAIPVIFESEEYRQRMQSVADEFSEKQEKTLKNIGAQAKKQNLAIVTSPQGFSVLPINQDGEVITAEEYAKLSSTERNKREKIIEEFTKHIAEFIKGIPKLQKERRQQEQEIKREFTLSTAGHLISDLKEKYQNFAEVLDYFDAVQNDVVVNVKDFIKQEEPAPFPFFQQDKSTLNRYQINVLVDNAKTKGAPVIFEQHPTYQNLICRVEHIAQFGALFTDFTLIKPGSLHKANGGYLVIDALKLFHHPFAWEGLKRALFQRKITIEPPERMVGLMSTSFLEPTPVPISVKVVLLGNRHIYYLLSELDPEFGDLFKVPVDFQDEVKKNRDNLKIFSRIVKNVVQKFSLRPFHRTAVAALIDHFTRIASDSDKFSCHMRTISNLIRESDFLARKRDQAIVKAIDVKNAVEEQYYRNDRHKEDLYELFKNNILMVDTDGSKVGQINGLSITMLGDYLIGKPSRISARVHYGNSGIVDIMRESKLGGPIHSKGVLILSGYLTGRYSSNKPLSLSATLAFEQSYSNVEGDSASAAELAALLSALAEVPIKQSLAITGSINQFGEIQPIGGVNEKIEGFFDICKIKGLTGNQGVIIPASNIRQLMLREDVVLAAKQKKFHIYSIETIDQAMTLLTGRVAGERGKRNEFPTGSLNYRVEKRLQAFASLRKVFQRKERKKP